MNAVDILREQYSKGEITESEFERAITYALNNQPRYCPHCGEELPLVPGGPPSCVCGWPDLINGVMPIFFSPAAPPVPDDLPTFPATKYVISFTPAPRTAHLCGICGARSTWKCAYCGYEVCDKEIESTDGKGWVHPCEQRDWRTRQFNSLTMYGVTRSGLYTGED